MCVHCCDCSEPSLRSPNPAAIGIYQPPDVRPILEAYRDKDIPLEYAKKEAEAKQKHVEEWQHRHGLATGGFTLSKLFSENKVRLDGFYPPCRLWIFGIQPTDSPIPPTYLEQKRHEAQLQYKEEQAYIAANKENFERLIREEQEAMAKQMPNTFMGAAGAMLQPPPGGLPDQQQQQNGDVKVVIDQPKSAGTS